MRRSIVRLGVCAASTAVLALAGASSAAAHSSPGVLIPTHPGLKLPLHGGTVDSLNWSGYAVTPKGGGVTAVVGTFTVPAASLLPPGFAATWAGIGGYNTSDLIQAGTSEQSFPSNPLVGPQYYAWYELLPASETQISGCAGDPNCTVKPGNKVKVTITQNAGKSWTISMTNAGHWSWSKKVSYNSSRSSAEWILEAPTVGAQTTLANVGTVHFGSASTFNLGATSHTIAQGSPTKIVLSPGGLINEATPSALAADGQSFNDCSYKQKCAAP